MIRFVNPTLDYALLAPILIVLGGALLVLIIAIDRYFPSDSQLH